MYPQMFSSDTRNELEEREDKEQSARNDMRERQCHVPGKACVHRSSRGIFSSEHSGPEQNQCTPGCGSDTDHCQSKRSDPDEAGCPLSYCHEFLDPIFKENPIRFSSDHSLVRS